MIIIIKEKYKVAIVFLSRYGFALYSTAIFFESLFSKMWMWSFQVKFSSTIIPKNFIDVVFLISKLFIFRIGSFRSKLSLSQDLWKRVNFVLLSFKESLFAWNQIAIFSNSMFAVWKKVLICFSEQNKFVSSANIIGCKIFKCGKDR